MRILHTADWHLGRELRGHNLLEDQAHALARLAELARAMAAEPSGLDAIVVAGDLYDRFTPSASAVDLLGSALAQLASVAPVLAIAGNHDSGERVGYASQILGQAGVHIAGKLQWPPVQVTVPTRCRVGADFVLVPYFEPSAFALLFPQVQPTPVTHQDCWEYLTTRWTQDLSPVPSGEEVASSVRPRVLVAHAFVQGGTSAGSERSLTGRFAIGGAETVPPSTLLGGYFDYGALGHLHRPQQSGDHGRVRYPGSLLPYSVDEGAYPHGALEVVIPARGHGPEVLYHPITPRRRVRTITGHADQIRQLASQETGAERQDYVLFLFPDSASRGDLTMPALRDLYPQALGMEVIPKKMTVTAGVLGPTDGTTEFQSVLPQRSPAEWTAEFLRRIATICPEPPGASELLADLVKQSAQDGSSIQ